MMIVGIIKTPEIDELKEVLSEATIGRIDGLTVQVSVEVCESSVLHGHTPSEKYFESKLAEAYRDEEKVYILSLANLYEATKEKNLDLATAIFKRFDEDKNVNFILSEHEVKELFI